MTSKFIFFAIAAGVGAYLAYKIIVTEKALLTPKNGSGLNGLYTAS